MDVINIKTRITQTIGRGKEKVGTRVFRKSPCEIFARACGARGGIMVEFGTGFQPVPNSTMIVQSGPRGAALYQKATCEKPCAVAPWMNPKLFQL